MIHAIKNFRDLEKDGMKHWATVDIVETSYVFFKKTTPARVFINLRDESLWVRLDTGEFLRSYDMAAAIATYQGKQKNAQV